MNSDSNHDSNRQVDLGYKLLAAKGEPRHSDAIMNVQADIVIAENASIKLVIPPAASLVPARARLVGGTARIHPLWSGITTEAAITAATSHNWGPDRVASIVPVTAVTCHRRSGSFQALSVKTGRTISGIGPHEQAQSEEMEVDPYIVDFDLQGLRAWWSENRSYTPDYHANHANDGLIAGEVKSDASYFLTDDYAQLMDNAARTLSAVGIAFLKVDATVLHANIVRRRNVRRAYCDRFTAASADQRDTVCATIAREGDVPLGRIHRILSNDPRTAQQMVHALLCRRILAYDLDQPVTPLTAIRAAPERDQHYKHQDH